MQPYLFRTANGTICCESDDVRHLCASCRSRAAARATDPYRAAIEAAPRTAQATDDAQYAPFAEAPDGYALALKARAKIDAAAARAQTTSSTVPAAMRAAIDPLDGYSLAIAAMRGEAR